MACSKLFSPRKYQSKIIEHVLEHPRCMVWAGMGMGKTASALFALDVLKRCGHEEAFPALVLAPLRVAASTWPDEVKKWRDDLTITLSAVIGTPKARASALKAKADVYATNYENLPWLRAQFAEKWPFKTVIADEATKLKSFRLGSGGVRARALGRVAFHGVERFIGLTGTPAPNGLEDLWGQFWFVDQGERLGRTFSKFHNRWFYPIQVAADPHAVKWTAKRGAQGEIEKAVADVTISVDPADYFDIDKPIFNRIPVKLPAKARRVYEELNREMCADLGADTSITAANAAALSVKCLQCAAGAVYTDDEGRFEVLHDEKLKALEDVVEEASGEPVLVAYYFKSDLVRLKAAFPKGRELGTDPKVLREWNAGKISLLFVHPASAGHGLNLQDGGRILVFFSVWWNLEQFQQVIERIGPVRQAQSGHPRPVFVHFIEAEDTLDGLVLKRLFGKASVQALLLEHAKRNKKAKEEKHDESL